MESSDAATKAVASPVSKTSPPVPDPTKGSYRDKLMHDQTPFVEDDSM